METAVKQHTAHPGVAIPRTKPDVPPAKLSTRNGIRLLFHRFNNWENWDWRIKYVLIAPVWLWLCIRARSFWFFTASNPTLAFGGFDGERKSEMYAQLPPGSFPRTLLISGSTSGQDLLDILERDKWTFPFVVKPDIGKMGLMFRKIGSAQELLAYHRKIDCDYLIQELSAFPLEVSVFYYRFPGSDKGNITGFVRKDFLEVTGDGSATLDQLIGTYPRVQFRLEEMRAKHRGKLDMILSPGEKYCLSAALNLSRGGKLVSLEHEKNDDLRRVFDDLSLATGQFYFGRYDIKCNSIEDLRRGKHFTILEFNGSGAEPHHVYGNGNSLWKACRILAAHWKILFLISSYNHQAGVPYWNFREGWKFLKHAGRHLKKLKQLDMDTPHIN